MYTTVTNGVGDLKAQARHKQAVHQMYRASMRKPCPARHSGCTCLDCTFVNLGGTVASEN